MQRPSPSTPAHRVRRVSIALAGLIAAFALLIPSAASAAAFTAKVHFPNHNPIAGKTVGDHVDGDQGPHQAERL